jgi:hypothetical protein
MDGQGGFRLGVDLAGGTILVYEVDAHQRRGRQVRQGSEGQPQEGRRGMKPVFSV